MNCIKPGIQIPHMPVAKSTRVITGPDGPKSSCVP